MNDASFRFRQFTVHQDKCAMKVGTDAVLLGSWIRPEYARNILDIGTGTGLIALMLAQKSTAEIDAMDIDEGAYLQARENFRISPWFYRMNVFHESFQEFARLSRKKYDLMVSNPPYFHHASKPSEASRLNARHNDFLAYEELLEGVKKLLAPHGRFILIFPSREGLDFMDHAQSSGLFCHHIVRIRTRADKQEKRLIMEFGNTLQNLTQEEIVIQEADNSFTSNYIELTREYYISLSASH
ncbi:MAG: methyltransferase [Bacteroidia bacterium]|nr:methyltransferase [Bacteroidia bacterium]